MTGASPRRAAVLVGTTLGLVYLATLAPGVTLWDAGEFASAVESLGIPHPPGTPLFILLARAWRLLLPFPTTVAATNLLAAASSAAAAALAASLVARWTRDTLAAVAAGLVFGGMSTVWLNATETEVYSASLLLSMVMLWVGFKAGGKAREPVVERRWDLLLAYLFALAPPLHLSAMVAAPGAIALATVDRDLGVNGSRAALLLGAAALAVGVGTGSVALAVAGVAVLALRLALSGDQRRRALVDTGAVVSVIAIAASAFLFLLLRSRLDPAINQGAPTTLAAVVDVMARRQYDVPGLWPRRAPFWLQIGNLFQYTDWQFALGLDRSVGASWLRTPFTPFFIGLGVIGSAWHRRRDRRSWAAMIILFSAATLGVVVYLNLRAGPSFGYGVLPPDADREARERDYFFALGFAAFGLWAGLGAAVFARWIAARLGRPRLVFLGVVIAALPIALNWRAVNRRREPAASLPNAFARAMLESAPPGAVLFVAGDNDTYPLWYAQVGGHVRPDVAIVTVPLIPATWYRAELARRLRLYEPADTARWLGTPRELATIAARVEQSGRPLVASVALEPELRDVLGRGWSFRGLLYVRTDSSLTDPAAMIDVAAIDSTAATIRQWFAGPIDPGRVDDPAGGYLTSLLTCPTLARQVSERASEDAVRLLASRCNFR